MPRTYIGLNINSYNWFIAARASSYVALTGFICVRSCNCYSMGIKAIIHSTSLHYGRVSGFSLFYSELFGGGVPTPESWAWQSIFQNLWVVWCWSLPELMAIDGN